MYFVVLWMRSMPNQIITLTVQRFESIFNQTSLAWHNDLNCLTPFIPNQIGYKMWAHDKNTLIASFVKVQQFSITLWRQSNASGWKLSSLIVSNLVNRYGYLHVYCVCALCIVPMFFVRFRFYAFFSISFIKLCQIWCPNTIAQLAMGKEMSENDNVEWSYHFESIIIIM